MTYTSFSFLPTNDLFGVIVNESRQTATEGGGGVAANSSLLPPILLSFTSAVRTGDSSSSSSQGSLTRALVASVQCVIILFTLLGNGLVVGAIVSFPRLRSVTNYFVGSLAVADLAVAVLVLPHSVLYGIWGRWTFGWAMCYFWMSCDVMCCTASILNLCVIAVDRYLAITEPLTYPGRFPSRHPGLVIAGVWACSAAISFGPIFAGWFADATVRLYEDSPDCGLHVNQVYAVVSSMTSFYCPLVVMVIVYTRIFSIARRQSKEIVKLEKSLDRNGYRSHAQVRRNFRDLKAIKTLGTLMGLFCISWLPFFVVYIVRPFCGCHISKHLDQTITWFGYCNSFFNPCVYALINRDFRVAYRRLLLCQKSGQHPDLSTSVPLALTESAVFERNHIAYNLEAEDYTANGGIQRNVEREPK